MSNQFFVTQTIIFIKYFNIEGDLNANNTVDFSQFGLASFVCEHLISVDQKCAYLKHRKKIMIEIFFNNLGWSHAQLENVYR